MQRLADMGEAQLLARIAQMVRGGPGVHLGVGDDAAVLRTVGPGAVLCTDMVVEDVDFRRRWATLADVGSKVAAVNLSDLAAMGARPRALLLSVAFPRHELARDALALVKACHRVGMAYGAPLVGGDLSHTQGPLVASVAAVGQVRPERALRRHRAQVSDIVLVSGTLGEAAAGLWLLEQGRAGPKRLLERQRRPIPRVALGIALAAIDGVHAACDVSDGLAHDVLHLLPKGRGVRIEWQRLPVARATRAVARAAGVPWQHWALYGGEDFELVAAVAPLALRRVTRAAERLGVTMTTIGTVTRAPGLTLTPPLPAAEGFDHFRSGPRV